MQLPRGTFRSLKKGCALHILIDELSQTAFTGYCRIVAGPSTSTLVFEKGVILIATYDTVTGDAAWARIVENGAMTVDAVINDLNAAQLDLALEFSPGAVVHNERGLTIEGDMILRQEIEKGPASLVADSNGQDKSHAARERLSGGTSSTSREGTTPVVLYPASGEQDGAPHPVQDDEEFALLRELDALDSMDIDTLAEKFRANCRVMIERFNLEHLIVQKTREESP